MNKINKDMHTSLSLLGVTSSALVVTPVVRETVVKSARNLQGIKTLPAPFLNVLDLLTYDLLIMELAALRKTEEMWAPDGSSDDTAIEKAKGPNKQKKSSALKKTTTVPKAIMKFICDAAKWVFDVLKAVCGFLLNGLNEFVKWLAYLSYLQAIINMLKFFEAFLLRDAQNAFSKSAEDWDAATEDENPGNLGLVECLLPDTACPTPPCIEFLTPEVCLSRGGTFEGMDLLGQLNDLDNQIQLLNHLL